MKTPMHIFTVLVLAALTAACAGTEPVDPDAAMRNRIGNAYGASQFDRIEAIRYTFNARIGDHTISRSWIWEPATDRVVLKSETGGADYRRGEIGSSEELRSVDDRFVNDNYWLLFPLHVYWDVGAKIADTGTAPLPIGPGSGRRLIVTYPEQRGDRAGDVYEVFVDGRFRIKQWIYRKKGAAEPTRVTTWEDSRRLGPLTVSLARRSADGAFRLWFTDVGVRLRGDKLWTTPK